MTTPIKIQIEFTDPDTDVAVRVTTDGSDDVKVDVMLPGQEMYRPCGKTVYCCRIENAAREFQEKMKKL